MLDGIYASGIGSLPHRDVDQALETIKEFAPYIPYWPQLPKRNQQELMLEAFLSPWVKEGLVIFQRGRGIFKQSQGLPYLELLNNNCLLPPETFPGLYSLVDKANKGEFAKAFAVKGHITGPNTLCKYNILENGEPLYSKIEIVDAVLNLVKLQIKEQLHMLRKLKLPVIIFIDEPGGFVSDEELSAQILQEGLESIIRESKSYDCYIGIHLCSKPNWQQLVNLPVDIISFDSFLYGESVLNNKDVGSFYKRGGRIAWGMVPTNGADWNQILARLEKYKGTIMEYGGLITPSCGLGNGSEGKAKEVMALVQKTVKYLNNRG